MIRINLFAACSQDSDDLKTKKEIIKKQCQKLNKEYAEKIRYVDHSEKGASSGQENNNVDFYTEENVPSIIPVTYDDPERRKEVHESYIKNKADIVIFLIGDKIDASLEKNLAVAVQRSKMARGPELLVYFKNDRLWDKLKSILGKDGRMYCMPEEDEEFEKNVEWMLRDHIRKYKNKRILQKWIKALEIVTVVAFTIALSIFIFYLDSKQKRLLIVGGGSATNYIASTFNINKNQRTDNNNQWFLGELYSWFRTPDKYWFFVPMPSGDSYRIIAEERINCHFDSINHQYYPIVASAEDLQKETVFLKSYDVPEFKKEGIVISIRLGYDTLVVYGSDSLLKSGRIIASDLDLLIQDTSISIWRTSLNSGTFNAYNRDTVCPSLKNRPDLKFFSDIDLISETKWIALGSAFYYPIYDKANTYRSIVEKNDKSIIKPIYIYFMLYKHKDTYVLPKATRRFLKKIDVDDGIIKSIIEIGNDTTIINDTTTILYEFPYKQ